jgi:hypothetical protein
MSEKDGLVGFYGHTFENGSIQYQFEILRKLDGARHVIQLFNFWDGTASQIKIYSDDFLAGEKCRLYPDAESWHAAYERESQQIIAAEREAIRAEGCREAL